MEKQEMKAEGSAQDKTVTVDIRVEQPVDGITALHCLRTARTLSREIRQGIEELLPQKPDGDFVMDGGKDGCTLRVSYMTVPDYRFLSRIGAWHYNFSPDEALVVADFRRAYGSALGEHFYGKWTGFGRDISRMIGYFGTDCAKGQAFMNIIMERVVQYEKRIANLKR